MYMIYIIHNIYVFIPVCVGDGRKLAGPEVHWEICCRSQSSIEEAINESCWFQLYFRQTTCCHSYTLIGIYTNHMRRIEHRRNEWGWCSPQKSPILCRYDMNSVYLTSHRQRPKFSWYEISYFHGNILRLNSFRLTTTSCMRTGRANIQLGMLGSPMRKV